jgi:hypothetical protein
VGLSSESFKYDGVNFTCLDMAGGKQYRNMWKDHYNGVEGIIFVVDSEDTGRLCVAEDELLEMLGVFCFLIRMLAIVIFECFWLEFVMPCFSLAHQSIAQSYRCGSKERADPLLRQQARFTQGT